MGVKKNKDKKYLVKISPRLPAPPPIHAGKPQHEGEV